MKNALNGEGEGEGGMLQDTKKYDVTTTHVNFQCSQATERYYTQNCKIIIL